jgi:branched-chain amino acid transport system permease protein
MNSILLINGIMTGSVYALTALGIVLINKATDVINFAQGEIVMLGAYFGITFHLFLGLPLHVSLLLTIFTSALFGIIIERVAYRPIIKAPLFSIILATLGMSIFLKNMAMIIWGPEVYNFFLTTSILPIKIQFLSTHPESSSVLITALFFMLILSLFFKYSKFGKAMRATSQNKKAAAMMGISVNKVFSATWAISSVLGAVSGFLLAPLVGVSPEMGLVLLKGFVCAIIGGFSSLPGAVVGGYFLGVTENLVGYYISTAYKDVFAYLVLMAVLLVKPTGFFERRLMKKV